jgi:CheY-like chemotaxis protein
MLGAAEYATKPVDRRGLSKILRKYTCPNPPCPVLLVEHDPTTRARTRGILEREGWKVTEAESGRIALESMERERPRLILLDLAMPEIDGFEFTERVRRQAEWRLIPIVVMAGQDLTADERKRLNGFVETIQYETNSTDKALLEQVRDLVAGCAARCNGSGQAGAG